MYCRIQLFRRLNLLRLLLLTPAVVPTVHAEEVLIQSDPRSPQQICRDFRRNLPEFITQGRVQVPENWKRPEDGKVIEVFYYADLRSEGTPLVFFNGGPATSSHSAFEPVSALARETGAPVVFIDQRGTGCSTPYPDQRSQETVERLLHYTSRSIVKDAEAVRHALFGGRKWNLFGQSYGGWIVHRYLEIAPGGINAAFAHGSSVMNDSLKWVELRIRSQKRVGEKYFETYPEDRERIQTLRAQLGPGDCFTDGSSRICGDAVLDAATALLGFQKRWSALHLFLSVLLSHNPDPDGNLQVDQDVLRRFVRTYVFDTFLQNGFASNVIGRIELETGVAAEDPMDSTGCERVLERLRIAGENPHAWSFNECRLLRAISSDWDPLLENLKAEDPLRLPVIRNNLLSAGIPFYLYSSGQDVFVPEETFREEVDLLGEAVRYHRLSESGHGGFLTEPVIRQDLARHTAVR